MLSQTRQHLGVATGQLLSVLLYLEVNNVKQPDACHASFRWSSSGKHKLTAEGLKQRTQGMVSTGWCIRMGASGHLELLALLQVRYWSACTLIMLAVWH